MFNAYQQAAQKVYADGDYARMTNLHEVETSAGDTLFLFVMRELGDEGTGSRRWHMDAETARQRIGGAIRDLEAVLAVL